MLQYKLSMIIIIKIGVVKTMVYAFVAGTIALYTVLAKVVLNKAAGEV